MLLQRVHAEGIGDIKHYPSCRHGQRGFKSGNSASVAWLLRRRSCRLASHRSSANGMPSQFASGLKMDSWSISTCHRRSEFGWRARNASMVAVSGPRWRASNHRSRPLYAALALLARQASSSSANRSASVDWRRICPRSHTARTACRLRQSVTVAAMRSKTAPAVHHGHDRPGVAAAAAVASGLYTEPGSTFNVTAGNVTRISS
jgi:hypothetical protein